MLGLTERSNYLTLKGSFSAVSKPTCASKYALESSRRDLHNALLCTALESNPKNQENHGGKRTWSNPGKNGQEKLLCTALESIIENWGKKNLAKTTPEKEENEKTRGH